MVAVMNERPVTADELPNTWALTTLGTVVDYGRTEKAEPEEFDDDDWILELEDIEKGTSRLLARLTCAQRLSKSTKNRFATGDVLYGKLRPYLNKVLIADRPGYCTTEIIPLKPGGHLDVRYLFYWLKHPAFLAYVAAKSHGMNMPRLGTAAGKAAPFVLAPRAEQQRIASQLDFVMSRSSACEAHLDNVSAILGEFRRAVLSSATTGTLTTDWRANEGAPFHWPTVSLGDVILEMRNGLSAKPAATPPGVKILRISAVRAGSANLSDHRFLDVSPAELTQYALKTNDLLFTRYNGSLEFVGVCAALRHVREPYVYPDKLIRVRVDQTMVLPAFVEHVFGDRRVRRQVEAVVKSSAGQKGVSGADLKRITFDLPSRAEQAEIVRRVESLFAIADRLEAYSNAARAHFARLTPLTLAKAFRGELVPQDPNDEPASELLVRIAAERASAIATPRARNRSQLKPTSAPKESAAMTKSRQDDDVKSHPYLARHLRRLGGSASAEVLFGESELPVSDFYKQLAWEIEQGLIRDGQTLLEASDAT